MASAGDDDTVRLWETRTGQALMVVHPGMGPVLAVAFSPDGSRLAAGGGTGGNSPVCLYRLTSRQEQRRLAGHTYIVHTVVSHPSRPLLASGSSDRSVLLWDLQTGRSLFRWDGARNNPITRVAFAPTGDLLAVGVGSFTNSSGRDYAVELREVKTAANQAVTLAGSRQLVGPQNQVSALAFDKKGKLLAAATGNGSTFLWNTSTGQPVQQWKEPAPVEGLAFLGEGEQLLVGIELGLSRGGRILLRNLASSQTVQEAVVPGGVGSLAVAPGESSLAVGGRNGALSILTLPELETRHVREKAHTNTVTTVAFSPDGRLLASGGRDRRVVLWDSGTLQPLATLPQNTDVHSLAFDPSGRHLSIAGSEHLITLWDLDLVHRELAAIGLDWDATLPKADLLASTLLDSRPPAPVTIVQAPRKPMPVEPSPVRPGPATPPVIKLSPAPKRRTATAAEIAGWVRQLSVTDARVRKAAADALVAVGPPAVPALRTAVARHRGKDAPRPKPCWTGSRPRSCSSRRESACN